jgi:hypothetical protein
MRLARLPAAVVCFVIGCSPANVGGLPDASGDGANGTNGADGGPTAEEACAEGAYQRCSHFSDCSPVYIQLHYGNVDTCRANIKAACMVDTAAPSSGSTPSSVEACASAIAGWDCNDYLDETNGPPQCVYKGTEPNGTPCGAGPQCQSNYCAIVPGNVCGKCADLPAPGSSCANLTTCGTGVPCVSATQLCQPYSTLGGACGAGIFCASNLACAGSSGTANDGNCQTAIAVSGASCVNTGPGCSELQGVSCSSLSNQCEPMQIAAGGQSCGDVNHQYVPCGAEGVCLNGTSDTPGVCRGASLVGGPCDLVSGPGCVSGSRCIVSTDGGTTGTCQIPSIVSCH